MTSVGNTKKKENRDEGDIVVTGTEIKVPISASFTRRDYIYVGQRPIIDHDDVPFVIVIHDLSFVSLITHVLYYSRTPLVYHVEQKTKNYFFLHYKTK